MLMEIEEPEYEKWKKIFFEEKTTKDYIQQLCNSINEDLASLIDRMIGALIKEQYRGIFSNERIYHIISFCQQRFAVPLSFIKHKSKEDFEKVLETAMLAVSVGVKLRKSDDELQLLGLSTFDYHIKKYCASYIDRTEEYAIKKRNRELEQLVGFMELDTEISIDMENYDIISVVEIYQSLKRSNGLRKLYSSEAIIDFIKGPGGQLIRKDVCNAFVEIMK